MDFETLPATAGAGGAITSPCLKPGASPLPNPPISVRIRVQEDFQQTIQGEGYWAGTPCDFIRLYGCPVGCRWCDTGYSDGGKFLPQSEQEISDLIGRLKSSRVVITGGEPFIQRNLPELVAALHAANKTVHIETSGAAWQKLPTGVWITLSPKQHLNPKYPVQPEFWVNASEIKIVISSGDELAFYRKWLPEDPMVPVFLQSEWDDRERTLPICLYLLRSNPGYRLSLQMHKYIGVR
jgi:7-carboxy-7-deazaguanine synthase